MTADLIPEFKVGERVIVHAKPIEYFCPHCGYSGGKHPEICGNKYKGKITERVPIDRCAECDFLMEKEEGWYSVWLDEELLGGQSYSVPYTLLERIEEST